MRTDTQNPGLCDAKYRFFRTVSVCLVSILVILAAGCAQLEKPKTEPFFAETAPPLQQEFRWSNGKTPKSLDPARASVAPETDIVRAIYEGLTELDAKTLKEVPAVAESWESSADLRTWTFHLRKDARWSNGENVTADDFVRSWKRLPALRDKAANKYLFQNIIGMKESAIKAAPQKDEPPDFIHDAVSETRFPLQRSRAETDQSNWVQQAPPHTPSTQPKSENNSKTAETPKFGVEAVDRQTLRVTLEIPDKDLPKLVANPIFRPVYGDGHEFDSDGLGNDIVTNGAFKVVSIAANGITLERADYYWNRDAVNLERVRFVPMETSEKALEAYRAGSIDAVTNAEFEPLALKLLTPFEDFRRTTHSALNFYEVNSKIPPFDDRRVREALAISIDRVKLTEGELEGSTRPAYSFLPLGEPNLTALSLDIDRAKELMAKAGFEGGKNFPSIRLVVNRNDTQQRVAKSVAKMWQANLNIETTIIVKESSEMEGTRAAGDYDLIRRGAVMPTADELVSLSSVFGPIVKNAAGPPKTDGTESVADEPLPRTTTGGGPSDINATGKTPAGSVTPPPEPTLSEEDSIFNIYAIPLYFPTSYSLVKPYVRGFEMNGLDAPSLKDVTIDSSWQPKATPGES